jgi:hypothetical protein
MDEMAKKLLDQLREGGGDDFQFPLPDDQG